MALGRLRPRSRKGAIGVFLAGVAVVAVAAVGLVVVLPSVYGEYGFSPEDDAAAWANLSPQYATSGVCQECHATQHATWQAAEHATVACESCHGPLAAHAETASETSVGTSPGAAPTSALCVKCHEMAPGKPAEFPVVDLTQHFAGGSCVGCHDSHSTIALVPPEIPHELANLPACTTCHKPAGLKPVPEGHVESADAVCLSCHKRPTAGQ